jgi:hypothetical protein
MDLLFVPKCLQSGTCQLAGCSKTASSSNAALGEDPEKASGRGDVYNLEGIPNMRFSGTILWTLTHILCKRALIQSRISDGYLSGYLSVRHEKGIPYPMDTTENGVCR